MQYKVIEASTAKKLAEEVSNLLAEGWALQGGVSVCGWSEEGAEGSKGWQAGTSYVLYAQALRLEEST